MARIKPKLAWALSIAGAALVAAPALAQDTTCGTDRKIDIAEMTWASASVLAHIHQIVLVEGYGCTVELVPGATVPTSASMIGKGEPAIAPELWMSSITDPWAEAEAAGTVVKLGDAITDGTIEGLFIPAALLEKYPELATMDGVAARPDLFPDPEDSSKGRVYSGPPGWAAELATSSLYAAYEMDENGWNLFSVDSGVLAASIKRAFLRDDPILFYYWGPTAVLGQVDAVKVELPPVDNDVYTCNTNVDCDEVGKTDWPSSLVYVGAAAWVADEAPAVAEYFGKVGMTNDDISGLLIYGDENDADARATAENFLQTRQDFWTKWVPADVAERVLTSIN